jgi:predicted transposase/invertase (TIGR01784 family)
MKHAIDPKIDCVFKALLGSEENKNLLIHFLNAFLAQELVEPLVSVDIINPYSDKEFLSDKLSIVDVKAQDSHEQIYQIEIQLTNYSSLSARIMYYWANTYCKQLKGGQQYDQLRPTYSIWLLAENLLSDDDQYVHHYKMRDEQGQALSQHGGIWLLELSKFNVDQVEREDQRWLKFFKDGEQLNDSNAQPNWMSTQVMKQAMNTLSIFSEKEHRYLQYQARQEYLRQQRTMQAELDEAKKAKIVALQEKEAALQEKETALQEKEAALAEIERLKALLGQ